MPDINWVTASTYADGMDLTDFATTMVAIYIDTRDAVLTARATNPAAFANLPAVADDSSEAFARRILGQLLDMGWKPPTTQALDDAVKAHGLTKLPE